MKKILVITIALAICLSALASCSKTTAAAEESYIAVDMAEAGVQFIVDSNDQVLAFSATTVEGEEVIDEEDYVGEDVETAIDDTIDNAIELGYIDTEATEEDPNAIMVTAEHYKNTFSNQWKEQMLNNIDATLEANGIWAIMLEAEDIEAITALAEQYNISAAKVRIILALQAVDPELTFEVAAAKSASQLMALIRSNKPLKEKIAELNTRVTEIEEELLILDEVTDAEAITALQTELTGINTELAALEAVRTTMQNSKTERKAAHDAILTQWKAEKQARVNSLSNRKNGNQFGFSDEVKHNKKAEITEDIDID